MLFRLSCACLSVVSFAGAHDLRADSPFVRSPGYELAGVVTDISNVPIPEVEVSVIKPAGIGKPVLTSREGWFSILGVPAGPVSIQVRRIGYEARVVDVQMTEEKRTSVEIVLKPVPAELEEMLIKADEREALREFYEHRKQRSSYGRFFDQNDVKKRGPAYPSDLFRSIPGVSLQITGPGNAVRIRGCQPMLWVDGQRIPNAEVDDVISPHDIAGLEFYSSMAGTPAQYLDRSTRACGTIIVWTKNR
jgi:hypothetical protein